MSDYQTQKCLPYSWEDLFALVGDVRDYPAFVPGIAAMRVWDEDLKEGEGRFKAEVLVRYKVFTERFSTHVVLDKTRRSIETNLLRGPFRQLDNMWVFEPLENGSTKIHFSIRYQVKNPLLHMLLSQNFTRAADAILRAFEERAREKLTPVGDDTSSVRQVPEV